MKYKEFVKWCNERACDGCWSFITATTCIQIMGHIKQFPFWRREKEWQKIKDEVERDIVTAIEEKRKELIGNG